MLNKGGEIARVPVMLGSSDNAGTSVATECPTCNEVFLPMTLEEQPYYHWVARNFPDIRDKLLQQYSLDKYKPFWAASKALTDFIFKCPTHAAAEILAGPKVNVPVYLYNFDVTPVGSGFWYEADGTPCAAGTQGVNLGSEVGFFLNHRKELATDYEMKLARALSIYVRNFAWSGDPNIPPPTTAPTPQLVRWKPFTSSEQLKLWIGMPVEGNITVRAGDTGLSCDLWR